jgi:O-6-methylguanine DNA methyltransferase
MASLNDNLFTILIEHSHVHALNAALQTQWGRVQVGFSEDRITHLALNDSGSTEPNSDPVFKEVFLNWLTCFQMCSAEVQWSYLVPFGSAFQQSVWRALLEVPFGQRVRYQDIAMKIGKPQAARAVGSAVGANPIAVLIPCHRVVPACGGIGQYRWGAERKRVLLDAERAGGSDLTQLFE